MWYNLWMLTPSHVRRLFDYNPTTGFLVWKISGSGRKGLRAGTEKFEGQRPQRRVIKIGEDRYNEADIIWCWMTGVWPTTIVDHENNNPFDNRWTNLRLATDTGNAHNRVHWGGSPLKWVQEIRPGEYRGRICANGKRICTQSFDNPLDAHNAALAVAKQLHGKFLRT
jgi:hypothetical protein